MLPTMLPKMLASMTGVSVLCSMTAAVTHKFKADIDQPHTLCLQSVTLFAARCDALARPMSSRGVCLCVRVSVMFVSCVKTNKDIFDIFSPSCSQAILVFPRQTGWRQSDGNPLLNGGVECSWGRQKNAILDDYMALLHTALQCYQPYESRTVKNKAATDGVERAFTTASVFVVRTRRRRSVCDGIGGVIRRRGGQTSPDTTPLVIIPVFCCRRTSQGRTRRVFLQKTDTNPYS